VSENEKCAMCGNGSDSYLHDRINCTAYHPFAPAPEAHDAPKPEARRPLSSYTREELDALYAPTAEEDKAFANASFVAPEARLTVKDIQRMKQNMVVASDAGDIWDEDFKDANALADECLAQREEIERLAGLLERWKAVADKGYTDDESGDGSTLLQETIEIENDTRAALAKRRKEWARTAAESEGSRHGRITGTSDEDAMNYETDKKKPAQGERG
jgi:hypothetical protein